MFFSFFNSTFNYTSRECREFEKRLRDIIRGTITRAKYTEARRLNARSANSLSPYSLNKVSTPFLLFLEEEFAPVSPPSLARRERGDPLRRSRRGYFKRPANVANYKQEIKRCAGTRTEERVTRKAPLRRGVRLSLGGCGGAFFSPPFFVLDSTCINGAERFLPGSRARVGKLERGYVRHYAWNVDSRPYSRDSLVNRRKERFPGRDSITSGECARALSFGPALLLLRGRGRFFRRSEGEFFRAKRPALNFIPLPLSLSSLPAPPPGERTIRARLPSFASRLHSRSAC